MSFRMPQLNFALTMVLVLVGVAASTVALARNGRPPDPMLDSASVTTDCYAFTSEDENPDADESATGASRWASVFQGSARVSSSLSAVAGTQHGQLTVIGLATATGNPAPPIGYAGITDSFAQATATFNLVGASPTKPVFVVYKSTLYG